MHAIHWLTDTVLIGVGLSIDKNVDLIVYEYKLNILDNSVEITDFVYENAMTNEERLSLKLSWYEQRPDYFEF